jgi:mannose-6-phosphate isomerase
MTLYPLRFEPIFQYRLWGGRALESWMNTPLPDGPIGEAWILSDRADHASMVAEGRLKGHTLTQLMSDSKAGLLGDVKAERFPLLLKFLDVRQLLSVQVHPGDDMKAYIPDGESGKTEAWVVLRADPESRIYAGLTPGTTADDLRHLTAKTADLHLPNFRPVAGQGVEIDAGTVHSLGNGVMVFEVQENSDVTYRLYDWDHIDSKTGKPRDLQIDQALGCVDFGQGRVGPIRPAVETTAPVRREKYFDNTHFRLWRLQGEAPFDVGMDGEARILVCIDGAGHVEHDGEDYGMTRGAVILLPAIIGVCRFRPTGMATVLEIAMPQPAVSP